MNLPPYRPWAAASRRTTTFAVTGGVSLQGYAYGAPSDPPVLLLHSLFFNGCMFEPLIDRLPPEYCFLCPDHRGQGLNAPADRTPDIDLLAEDAIRILEALDTGPVDVVGSSMGGYVAMRIAARRSDLVASCALMCCTSEAEREVERFATLEARLRQDGPAAWAEQIAYVMFGDDFLTLPERAAERSRWTAGFRALPPSVADAVKGVSARRSMELELAQRRLSFLLVAGEQDHAKRPSDMEKIARLAPESRLIVFAGVGHTPAIEAPERLAAELSAWWRTAAAQRSAAGKKVEAR